MGYSSHSRRFQEVASLYIKDGEVIKYRGHDLEEATDEQIVREMNHKNKVIIEKDKVLYCYFKDEDKYVINRIIKELKENYGMIYIEDYVEFC